MAAETRAGHDRGADASRAARFSRQGQPRSAHPAQLDPRLHRVDAARSGFGPIGNARYKGYVEDIHQSGLYALSLLNDLLDISKIEAGKFELDFTAVEVPELVEDCVGSCSRSPSAQRIVLRTSLQPESADGRRRPAPAEADPAQPSHQRHQVHQGRRTGDRVGAA